MVNHRSCDRLLLNRDLPHGEDISGQSLRRLKSLCLSLLAALFTIAASTAHAAFTASVNRASLASHETVELTLRTDESSSASPDLAPLEKSFDVLDTRQQSQTRIINGRREYNRDWVVTLAPRQQGSLVIPAITLGDQQSEPITISVGDKSPDASSGDAGPLFMRAEVSSETVYVQQELLFTLQILFSVQLYDDNRLSPIDISDALVQQLGEPRKFDTIINGIRYRGFELKYAIHPQTAGKMIIPPMTFSGVAVESRDPFPDIFSRSGKPVVARSPEIRVDVKPQPGNYPANETWLPARNLSIEQQWSKPLHTLRVGDAITRTITVDADGLSAAQLPPILMPQPEGVNSYPDKSVTEDRETINGVQGQRTDSIAMIPTRAGKITLPAIQYTWFDTDSDTVRTSTLPVAIIEVAPEPGSKEQPLALTPAVPETSGAAEAIESPAPGAVCEPDGVPAHFWQTVGFWQGLTALFALLASLSIWQLRLKIKTKNRGLITGLQHTRATSETNRPGVASETETFKKLEAACQQQDVPGVLNELKNWSRLYLHNEKLTSLSECLDRLGSKRLQTICQQLSASLYAAKPDKINSEVLLTELLATCRAIRSKKPGRDDQQLGKLYPE